MPNILLVKYTEVAKAILQKFAASAYQMVHSVSAGGFTFEAITYRDFCKIYDGINEAIVPGIFLVLFYFLIAMFGNQMLTSTTEEKQNRYWDGLNNRQGARTHNG